MEESDFEYAEADVRCAWVKGGGKKAATTATGKALQPAGSTGRSLAPPGVVKKRNGSSKRGGGTGNLIKGDDSHRSDLSSAKGQGHCALSNGGTASGAYQRYFEFSEATRSQLEDDLRGLYEQLEVAQKLAENGGGGGGGGCEDGDAFDLDGRSGEDDPNSFGGDDLATRQLVAKLEERHEVLEAQLTNAWDEVIRKGKACRRAHNAVEDSNTERHRVDIESSTSLALAARQLGE